MKLLPKYEQAAKPTNEDIELAVSLMAKGSAAMDLPLGFTRATQDSILCNLEKDGVSHVLVRDLVHKASLRVAIYRALELASADVERLRDALRAFVAYADEVDADDDQLDIRSWLEAAHAGRAALAQVEGEG